MITSADIRTQVAEITDASEGRYDVDAITADLIAEHDLTGPAPADTVATLDEAAFWGVVATHAID